MKKVLYINGNPQAEEKSYSRRAGKYYREQLTKSGAQVSVLDLYEADIPLIDGDVLAAWGHLMGGGDFKDLTEGQQAKVSRMGQVLQEFKEADEYVFVTPMWNFGVPPLVKAYLDNVMIAGETFKYTENGPVGLLEDKKATVIIASGGVYDEEPAASANHATTHLATALGFMGITDLNILKVDGIAIPGKSDEERLSEAYKEADALLAVG